MKPTIFLILSLLILLSCKDEEVVSPDLIGTWRLTEVLADPGDGSGIFNPVDSDKTITFLVDERVQSNATLCNFSTRPEAPGEGFYSLQDSTITPTCPDQEFESNIWFKLEGSNLILTYQCIEACAEKYVKR